MACNFAAVALPIDNVAVVAAVYNDEWHQGYSYPPSTKPFDAYYVDDATVAVPNTLWADTYTIPETGGTSNFTICPGTTYSFRQYAILGSYSGTEPGWPLPGGQVVLPINRDWFTNMMLGLLNSGFFDKFMGTIKLTGQASASLVVPPLPPGFRQPHRLPAHPHVL